MVWKSVFKSSKQKYSKYHAVFSTIAWTQFYHKLFQN